METLMYVAHMTNMELANPWTLFLQLFFEYQPAHKLDWDVIRLTDYQQIGTLFMFFFFHFLILTYFDCDIGHYCLEHLGVNSEQWGFSHQESIKVAIFWKSW
jgi:hypothetical protein